MMGRGIALLFHDRGTRRGEWSAARHGRTLPPGKDPVPIVQEAGWVPGPVWTDGKSRPHRDLIPDHPACSQSLYRLSYPAHHWAIYWRENIYIYIYIYRVFIKITTYFTRVFCRPKQRKNLKQTNTSQYMAPVVRCQHVYCMNLKLAITVYHLRTIATDTWSVNYFNVH